MSCFSFAIAKLKKKFEKPNKKKEKIKEKYGKVTFLFLLDGMLPGIECLHLIIYKRMLITYKGSVQSKKKCKHNLVDLLAR